MRYYLKVAALAYGLAGALNSHAENPSPWNTRLDKGQLAEILKAEKLDSKSRANLREILSDSQGAALRRLERNIETLKRTEPGGNELADLVDFRDQLLIRRAEILRYIGNSVTQVGKRSEVWELLASICSGFSEKENLQFLNAMLLAPGIDPLKIDDDCHVLINGLLQNLQGPQYFHRLEPELQAAVTSYLSKISTSDSELLSFRGRRFQLLFEIPEGHQYLVELGDAAADTTGNLTDLSEVFPKFFQLLQVAPDPLSIALVELIGINVARFQHPKLRSAFFNNVKLLKKKFEKTGDLQAASALQEALLGLMAGDEDWQRRMNALE